MMQGFCRIYLIFVIVAARLLLLISSAFSSYWLFYLTQIYVLSNIQTVYTF